MIGIRLLTFALAMIPSPAISSSIELPQQLATNQKLQLINCSRDEENISKINCFLNGEKPIDLTQISTLLAPERLQSPQIEKSQMLPSDKLINQSFPGLRQ